MNYWLMKSEPDVFGIDDLKNRPGRTEPWDGVRNYQARNMMREKATRITLPSIRKPSTTTPRATPAIRAGTWWT